MANTTDMIITCLDDGEVVAAISEKTGIDFLKVSDGNKAGGQKALSLEAYGACYRSIGLDKINEIITAFNSAEFDRPELASLIIDDDDGNFSGTIARET